MEINGVKIRDSHDIVARRVAKYFGFSAVGYSFGTVIYMKTRFQRKYKIFGLFSAIDFWEEADELGKFTKDWSVFDIKHPDNAPVAALLVKKFHQEFWSGAGYRSFVVWAPMVLPEGAGTLELIKKSHTWGHIPHCNREPTQLPNDAESVIVDCHEGDLLIFHSLTLHRTVPNPDIS